MTSRFHSLLCFLRQTAAGQAGRDLPDSQVLEQFVQERREEAFAEIMRRHGPMVLNVCRRVLKDEAEAEDAFQATFIVLARRAERLRLQSVGAWLHGVALRVALKARTRAQLRGLRERQAMETTQSPDPVDFGSEIRPLLDEELQRMPRKYREPLVLCYLEGKTADEACAELGYAKRSLERWMGRGRQMLQKRLELRGVTASASAVSAIMVENTSGQTLSRGLVDPVTKVAVHALDGQDLADLVSAGVLSLADGVLRSLQLSRLAATAVVMTILSLVLSGAGLLAYQMQTPPAAIVEPPGSPPSAEPVMTASFTHAVPVTEAVLSHDDALLATVCRDSSIWIWRTGTKNLCSRTEPAGTVGGKPPTVLAFSRDQRVLATQSPGDVIRLYEVATGRPRGSIGDRALTLLTSSPEADAIVVRSSAEKIAFWDMSRNCVDREFEVPKPLVECIAFSPCGRTLAAACKNDEIRVWGLDSNVFKRLHVPRLAARKMTVSRDERLLALLDAKNRLLLWNLELDANPTILKTVLAPEFLTYAEENRLMTAGPLGDVQEYGIQIWSRDRNESEHIHMRLGMGDEFLGFANDSRHFVKSTGTEIQFWSCK